MKNKFQFLFQEEGGEGSGGGGGQQTIVGGQQTPAEGGNTDQPWFHSLPDDLRNNPFVAQNDKLESFVKAAVDTKAMVGANTIKLPGEKATLEERAEFFKKLGRPDDFKGYETSVKPSEGVYDEKVFDQMRAKFHELGLTKAQGDGILSEYIGVLNQGLENAQAQQTQSFEAGVNALRSEWGTDYDNNVKMAQLALRELGGDTFIDFVNRKGLGNDPDFIKFLHGVGAKLVDDDASGQGEGRFTQTSVGAQQEIARLKADDEFQKILNTAHHPGHKDAVERWMGLHRLAYPGKQED